MLPQLLRTVARQHASYSPMYQSALKRHLFTAPSNPFTFATKTNTTLLPKTNNNYNIIITPARLIHTKKSSPDSILAKLIESNANKIKRVLLPIGESKRKIHDAVNKIQNGHIKGFKDFMNQDRVLNYASLILGVGVVLLVLYLFVKIITKIAWFVFVRR